jgi:hypothetical protein
MPTSITVARHIAIAVELGDQRQQLVLARRRRKPMIRRPHAGFDRHLLLGADIDLARRVVAHERHRQTWVDATLSAKALDCRLHARTQVGGNRFSIDQGRGHGVGSSAPLASRATQIISPQDANPLTPSSGASSCSGAACGQGVGKFAG